MVESPNPPDVSLKNTGDIAFISSTHGRLRRFQRDVTKRDLQSAVKYGTAEKSVLENGSLLMLA